VTGSSLPRRRAVASESAREERWIRGNYKDGEVAGDFDAGAALAVAVGGLAPQGGGQAGVVMRAPSVRGPGQVLGAAEDEIT